MRQVALQAFNDSHFNKRANTSGYKIISINKSEKKFNSSVFKDVLDTACRYDIYDKLGLTVLDLMKLDFNKYIMIRDKVKEILTESESITDKFKEGHEQ